VGLRNLSLKEEYRSDKDNLIAEFFVPCLSNCIEYDRCIEYVSMKSLTTLSLGMENFASNHAKMRIITGHRLGTRDMEILSKLFSNKKNGKLKFSGNLIRDSKLEMIKSIIDNNKLEIKIAIPSSEEIVGSFAEKIGIFIDENDDAVAFTGTSNETFNTQNKNFESVDVFTSWDDKSRVAKKISNFNELWENKTEYVEIYDFDYAEENNLLKYSTDWAIDSS